MRNVHPGGTDCLCYVLKGHGERERQRETDRERAIDSQRSCLGLEAAVVGGIVHGNKCFQRDAFDWRNNGCMLAKGCTFLPDYFTSLSLWLSWI